MRYRLRTLLILLAVMPPLLAYGWSEYEQYRERERLREELTRQAEELQKLKPRRTYPYFQLDVF